MSPRSRAVWCDVGLLVLCSALVWVPFCHPRPLLTNDDSSYATHLALFDREVREGQIPVRWTAEPYWGYGSTVFLFVHHLVFYLAEPFVLLGVGLLGALKATWVLIVIGACLSMYLFARRILDRHGALVAATVYVYTPCLLDHVFRVGALSSTLSFALYPLALHGLCGLAERWRAPQFVTAATAVALLTLAHAPNAAIILPFLFLYPAISPGMALRRKLVAGWLALALGLGLAAWYWLPLVGESGYVQLTAGIGKGIDTTAYVTETATWRELFSSLWRLTWSPLHVKLTGDPLGDSDRHLGVVPILLTALSVAAFFRRRALATDPFRRQAAFFWLCSSLVSRWRRRSAPGCGVGSHPCTIWNHPIGS